MSRTSRTGTAEGFWATVDDWAGSVVTTGRLRAWSSSRCRLVAVSGPYLDVTDDLDLPDLSVLVGEADRAQHFLEAAHALAA